MEKAQILKETDNETVYELVDANDVDVVLENGLFPKHCVFIDNCQDYQEETKNEAIENSGEVKPYLWQYDETIALLNLIEQHYDSIQHERKRQLVWKNISCELESQDCAVDAGTCHRKWRNLIRSYNTIKRNRNSGKKVKFQFYNEVHHILSKRRNKIQESEKGEKVKHVNVHDNKYHYIAKRKRGDESESNTSNYFSNIEDYEEPEAEVVITYVEKKSRATQTTSRVTPIRSRVRKRKNFLLAELARTQQQYLERDRLIQKRRIMERQEERNDKERRFQEKLLLKKERLELDRKKVELLEQYLSLKMQGKI